MSKKGSKQKRHPRKSKYGKLFWAGSKPFSPMPKKYIHLPIKTVVYVPSTFNDKEISDKEYDKRIEQTRKELSELFGGYTSVSAVGGWVSNGGLIKENITEVSSFTNEKTYLKKRKGFLKWLEKKRKEWKQSEIGYEMEGDFWRIQS